LRSLLLRFIVTSVAILAVAKLLPGIEVHSLFALIMTVVILGILNVLGLFLFIINGIILYLVSLLIDGFEISGLFVAIIASILITIVSGVINWLAKE